MSYMKQVWADLQEEPDQDECYCDNCREEDRQAWLDQQFDMAEARGFLR